MNSECSICKGDMSQDDILEVLSCGHTFHPPCISSWISYSRGCPLCKKQQFLNADIIIRKQKKFRERRFDADRFLMMFSNDLPRVRVENLTIRSLTGKYQVVISVLQIEHLQPGLAQVYFEGDVVQGFQSPDETFSFKVQIAKDLLVYFFLKTFFKDLFDYFEVAL
jgi:hypothetical protein